MSPIGYASVLATGSWRVSLPADQPFLQTMEMVGTEVAVLSAWMLLAAARDWACRFADGLMYVLRVLYSSTSKPTRVNISCSAVRVNRLMWWGGQTMFQPLRPAVADECKMGSGRQHQHRQERAARSFPSAVSSAASRARAR